MKLYIIILIIQQNQEFCSQIININYKNGNNKIKQNIVQLYNIVLPEYRLLMYMDIVVILVTPQPGAVWRSKGPHL